MCVRNSTLSTPGGLNNQFKQTYFYDQDGRPTTHFYDGCTNGACTSMGSISTVYDGLGRKSRMLFPDGQATWMYGPAGVSLIYWIWWSYDLRHEHPYR